MKLEVSHRKLFRTESMVTGVGSGGPGQGGEPNFTSHNTGIEVSIFQLGKRQSNFATEKGDGLIISFHRRMQPNEVPYENLRGNKRKKLRKTGIDSNVRRGVPCFAEQRYRTAPFT